MLFAEYPLTQDLSALSRKLNERNIPHRFTEEDGVQKFWLLDERHIEEINEWMNDIESLTFEGAGAPAGVPRRQIEVLPYLVTITIIICGVLGYLLDFFEARHLMASVMFAPFDYIASTGQIWRLVTPAFLHFGEMHILFNALWIWEVGKRLEPFMGKVHYCGLFLVCALVSNILQYSLGGSLNFGGLSGVVYGYFGCIFILHRIYGDPRLFMPPGIFIFMMIWLAVGFFGLIDFFIAGSIANWAHFGGLIAGAMYAGFHRVLSGKRS